LIKALLAQPLSQPSLLLGMQRILNAASQADARQPQQLLQQLLLPFVSFVMLQPDTQGDSSSLCHYSVWQMAVRGTTCNAQLPAV